MNNEYLETRIWLSGWAFLYHAWWYRTFRDDQKGGRSILDKFKPFKLKIQLFIWQQVNFVYLHKIYHPHLKMIDCFRKVSKIPKQLNFSSLKRNWTFGLEIFKEKSLNMNLKLWFCKYSIYTILVLLADKPIYYWPLIFFLDERGCILEGVRI